MLIIWFLVSLFPGSAWLSWEAVLGAERLFVQDVVVPCSPVVGAHSPSLATFLLWLLLLRPVAQSPAGFLGFVLSMLSPPVSGISQAALRAPCPTVAAYCVHSHRAGLPPEHPQAVGKDQGCVLATFSCLGASLALLSPRTTEYPESGGTCRDHRVQALSLHRVTQNPHPISEGESQSHLHSTWLDVLQHLSCPSSPHLCLLR